MIPPQVLLAGGLLMGKALKALFGESGRRSGRIHYTLYAVSPHRLADFAEQFAPTCSVVRFCDLLREHGYEESGVREFLGQAREMERRHPGDVVMVAGVREE